MTPLTASTCAWTCTILFPGRDACAPKGGISTGRRGGAGRRAKTQTRSTQREHRTPKHGGRIRMDGGMAGTTVWSRPRRLFFHCYETPPRPSRTRRRRIRGWLRRLQRRTHPAPAFAWLRSDRRMPTRTVPENGSQTRPAPRGRLQLNKTAPSRKLRSPKWPLHFV